MKRSWARRARRCPRERCPAVAAVRPRGPPRSRVVPVRRRIARLGPGTGDGATSPRSARELRPRLRGGAKPRVRCGTGRSRELFPRAARLGRRPPGSMGCVAMRCLRPRVDLRRPDRVRPRARDRGYLPRKRGRGRAPPAIHFPRDPPVGREARELPSGRGLARRVRLVGRSGPRGAGSDSSTLARDSPGPRAGVSPCDRVPMHLDRRGGGTVPHLEPGAVGRGGAPDLWIFRPHDRRIARVRPERIDGPDPNRHGGARSPPDGSRRTIRSEGECLPVFDPRNLGPDGSRPARVPRWHENRIKTRCVVSAVAGPGVQDLRQHRGTVATVVAGWIAVRAVRV